MDTKLSRSGILLPAIILLAIFVVPTSISGTAVALPAIAVDLHAPITDLQWVVNGFNLMFACFTLVWGAVADRFGRKFSFLIGVAIYSFASLLSGLAQNPIILDFGRALAGIGAAAIFACGIALLSINFSGAARLRVFALFGTVAGLGVSLGPTISGALLDSLGWRSIFISHLVVLLFVLLYGGMGKVIPWDNAGRKTNFNFDIFGVVLFIAAMFTLMLMIVQVSQWGLGNDKTITLMMASLILFFVFWAWEKRHSMPILDLSLLKNGQFVGYSLVTVAGSFAFVTLLTYFPTYIISVLNMTATEAGITMFLLTAPMLFCPVAAGKLVARGFSSYVILMMSLLFLLVGLGWLALVSGPTAKVLYLAPALMLIGSGFGTAAGLVDGLALHSIPEEKAGMAVGLFNTFRLGSEAIAVSIYGSTIAALLYFHLDKTLLAFNKNNSVVDGLISAATTGNFKTICSVGDKVPHGNFSCLLGEAYNHAFVNVVWMLFSVVFIVSIIIGILIRSTHGSEGR